MIKKEPHKFGYSFFKAILAPIFKFYYRPTYINKEVIPKDGPIIICGNHKHLYDQCLTITSTKRMLHYMAKKEYFDGKFAWFFKTVGCISVNREIKDVDSKNKAIDLLNENYAVGIFPEGTRNKTEEILQPLKFGTVSMAQKTNATLVPFAITGDYVYKSKNLKIRYGIPFKVNDMSLEEANKKLENELLDLLNQK
ncbi:1-acyl-sn-glycerol-3-phosphate acyltransferase [bacterium]|nr:1-acyl-sn-glycerol-3-phosphate acyltransferase [bacterium]